MKQYLYIVLLYSLIVITGIGCAANQFIADTCETRAVSTAMKFKIHDISHRLAVGKDHVAIQILKEGEWEFLDHNDTRYFQPIEYMSLQRYLEYLIIRYNAEEGITFPSRR